MSSRREAQARHDTYYAAFVRSHATAYDLLDQEFAQIQIAYSGLADQSDQKSAQTLLDLIEGLAAYLQRRALNSSLLEYTHRGLRVAQQLGINAGWLHLLIYEAYWAMGEWDAALASVQTALEITRGIEPKVYGRSLLALGRLQFNRGDYQVALQTLAGAEALFTLAEDNAGVAAVEAEKAAYYLNRNELDKALRAYLQVDKLRRQIDPAEPGEHTQLMLGVVYRRMRKYPQAVDALTGLIQQGAAQRNLSALATGTHHLAWVYYDRGQLAEATKLGTRAKELYEELRDPRGSSDADEQLGLIALARRDFTLAQNYLERSLSVRLNLGNQQGSASSLRRLAKLHLRQGNIVLGVRYLWRSLTLYRRIGVLGIRQLLNIFGDLVR